MRLRKKRLRKTFANRNSLYARNLVIVCLSKEKKRHCLNDINILSNQSCIPSFLSR